LRVHLLGRNNLERVCQLPLGHLSRTELVDENR
jgi:hypothetical protein